MINIILLLFNFVMQKQYCIVFFTGGSNFISTSLYSDFLSKVEKNNFDIYKLPFNIDAAKSNKIISNLNANYHKVIFVGHSSGCTTAINKCSNKIDQLILLDPVKTPFFKNKNIDYLENVLFINAEKSYKWSIFPPFLPFIPILRITPDDLIIDREKIDMITVKDYGHSDIINNPYRNLMHYSRISRGVNNRCKKYINAYHNFIIKQICDLISKVNNFDILLESSRV